MRQKKKPKYLNPATVLLIKQIFFGLLVFLGVILIITIIWHGTRLETFTINQINVSGGYTIDKDRIKQVAEEQLEGTYLKLIPRRFSYFYPETAIYDLVNQFERIKDVRVDRVSRHEVNITFDEYLPDSLWCSYSKDTPCYFLDETGFAFAVAPDLSGRSMMRYFSSEQEPEEKASPFAEADYQNAKLLAELLHNHGWFVSAIEINSNRDAFYTFTDGGEIKVTMNLTALETMDNLLTVIGSAEFDHLKPGNFQYLDLRFDTRVFVNEELPEEESVATSTASFIDLLEETEASSDTDLENE